MAAVVAKFAWKLGALGSLVMISSAWATPFVHFDINDVTITSGLTQTNAAGYTGSIILNINANTYLEGFATGDTSGGPETPQPTTGSQMASLTGTLNYVDGVISPGSTLNFNITTPSEGIAAYNGIFDDSGDTAGASQIAYSYTQGGVDYFNDEEDANPSGVGPAAPFEGVNLSPFQGPFKDSDVVISDIPGTNTANIGNLDIFVIAPEPAMGLLGLAALLPWRKRR